GQAIELQLENGVYLPERETAFLVGQALAIEVDDNLCSLTPGVQVFAGFGARTGGANNLDDRVEVVEGDLVALKDMFAFARFAQQEGGAALHHIDAMIDECADR